MADKENKFLSEIKNQVIAGIGLVIAAGFGIFITNMEAWFTPTEKEEPVKVAVQDTTKTNEPKIIINIPESKERVKVIEVPVEKKEEEKISW